MTPTAHWDDVRGRVRHTGDIHATWFNLGRAAGSDGVGLQRIRIEPGVRIDFGVIEGRVT